MLYYIINNMVHVYHKSFDVSFASHEKSKYEDYSKTDGYVTQMPVH
jgi:hypothetical protein